MEPTTDDMNNAAAQPSEEATNRAPASEQRSDQPLSGRRTVDAALTEAQDATLDGELDAALAGLTEAELSAAADSAPASTEAAGGEVLQGRVANVGSEDMLIDFDGKQLGTMPLSDVVRGESYHVGDPIEVAVVGEDSRSGLLAVSRKRAKQIRLFGTVQPGQVVEGVVSGMNKGGLEVDIDGVRGFIPASQVDLTFLKDISCMLGQTIKAEVMKFEPADENLVLSRRKVLEAEAEAQKRQILDELEVGQVRRGRVKGLADYGAFVDLGGVDGLLHVSDMSWGRVNKPEEVVKVGDEIDVKVIKVQKSRQRISLSLRQTTPNPWSTAAGRYLPGARVTGKVVRLQNFGAFVELEPGVEALLPISEMSWTHRVRHPQEIVKEGETIEAAVLNVDGEKRRISLSLKQLKEDPWSAVARKYPVNELVKGKVVRTTEFGAFVELEEGVDGLIHISELSEQRVKAVTDKVKVGQEVEVRVLAVDPENKRVSLSMKPPPREPTPEERARWEKERADAEKRRRNRPQRGGITFSWDQGLEALDPAKFGQ